MYAIRSAKTGGEMGRVVETPGRITCKKLGKELPCPLIRWEGGRLQALMQKCGNYKCTF